MSVIEYTRVITNIKREILSKATQKRDFNITLEKALIRSYNLYKTIPNTSNDNDYGLLIELVFVLLYVALNEFGTSTSNILVDIENGSFCNKRYIDYCNILANPHGDARIHFDEKYLNWTHMVLYIVYLLQMGEFPVIIDSQLKQKKLNVQESFVGDITGIMYTSLIFRLINTKYAIDKTTSQIRHKEDVEYAIFVTLVSFYNSYNINFQERQEHNKMFAFINTLVNSQILSKPSFFTNANLKLNLKTYSEPKRSLSSYMYPLKVEYFFKFDNISSAYNCLIKSFLEENKYYLTRPEHFLTSKWECFKQLNTQVWKNSIVNYMKHDGKILLPVNATLDWILYRISDGIGKLYTDYTGEPVSFWDFSYYVIFALSIQYIYVYYQVMKQNESDYGVHTFNIQNDYKIVQAENVSLWTRIKRLLYGVGNPIDSINISDQQIVSKPFLAWVSNNNNINSKEYTSIYKVVPLPKADIKFKVSVTIDQEGNVVGGRETSDVQKKFEQSIKSGVIDKSLPKIFQKLALDTFDNSKTYNKIIDDFKRGYIMHELPLSEQVFIKKAFNIKKNYKTITLPEFDSKLYNVKVLETACSGAKVEKTIHTDKSTSYSVIVPLTQLEKNALHFKKV